MEATAVGAAPVLRSTPPGTDVRKPAGEEGAASSSNAHHAASSSAARPPSETTDTTIGEDATELLGEPLPTSTEGLGGTMALALAPGAAAPATASWQQQPNLRVSSLGVMATERLLQNKAWQRETMKAIDGDAEVRCDWHAREPA